MVGLKRLENVKRCVEQVSTDGVPGDLIETGVWRGGVVIFMRAILDAWGDPDRTVFAADSFRGLPPPDEAAYPADAGSKLHQAESLAISRAEVERNFALYGLLDERVKFLEGWFADTLPAVARPHVRRSSASTATCTGRPWTGSMNLYPRLSVGGFLIVDDYAIDSVPAGRRRLPRRERDRRADRDRRLGRRVLAPGALTAQSTVAQ